MPTSPHWAGVWCPLPFGHLFSFGHLCPIQFANNNHTNASNNDHANHTYSGFSLSVRRETCKGYYEQSVNESVNKSVKNAKSKKMLKFEREKYQVRISVQVLGTVRVCREEEVLVDEPSGRVATLLVYLACHLGGPVRRDTLVSTFWPESDTESARKSLRVYLTQIRKMLGQMDEMAFLGSDYKHVWLDKSLVTADTSHFLAALQEAKQVETGTEAEFQALTGAVESYTGLLAPYLEEEWIAEERRRLNDLFITTAMELVSLLRERQLWERAIATARKIVESEPLREDGHELLIQVYQEAGRPASARNHYAEMERFFKGALGTSPSPHICAMLTGTTPVKNVAPLSTTTATYHLPLALDPILGRETEAAEVQALLLEGNRLVTITGFGGTGKTRLAREIAEQTAQYNTFGAIVWAPLADITEAEQIGNAILSSLPPLAKKRKGGETPTLEERLIERLSETSTLLVLDNLEHLSDKPVHILLRFLLTQVPTLVILTTSRRRLRLSGEQTYFLTPLALPETQSSPEIQQHNPSVQLFLSRARQTNPHFAAENGTLTSICLLCHALEGLPLAIEMAAARVRVLAPDRILARLEKRFDLLINQNTDTPERHRSLHATLQWSYDLLSAEAQQILKAISVLRGWWTLEAAEAMSEVAGVLDSLTELIDASLLIIRSNDEDRHYQFLETVREFAFEQITEKEKEMFLQRHSKYYLKVARENTHLRYDIGLLKEEANIIYALQNGLSIPSLSDDGVRILYRIRQVWYANGRPMEVKTWFANYYLVRDKLSPAMQIAVCYGYGWMEMKTGSVDIAESFILEGIEYSKSSENHIDTARGLLLLAMRDKGHGVTNKTVERYKECIEFCETYQSNDSYSTDQVVPRLHLSALGECSHAYYELGETEKSYKIALYALEKAKLLQDKNEENTIYFFVVLNEIILNMLSSAEDNINKMAIYYTESSNKVSLSSLNSLVAKLEIKKGSYKESIRKSQNALQDEISYDSWDDGTGTVEYIRDLIKDIAECCLCLHQFQICGTLLGTIKKLEHRDRYTPTPFQENAFQRIREGVREGCGVETADQYFEEGYQIDLFDIVAYVLRIV
jgi:predicted ATPase/DNA-binding SARP family transcriptional activator